MAAGKRQPGKAAPSERKRTAVLVFHGIGDQRPMETLHGVVDAVLGAPEAEKPIKRWVRPYVGADGAFDLKSITTEAVGASRTRYDFFEFYWAPLMSGTRLVAVILWLCDLAKRDRRRLPADAWWVWHLVVAILVGALMASVHLLWVVGLTLIGTGVEALAARHDVAAVPVAAFFVLCGLAAAWFAFARLGKGVLFAARLLAGFLLLAFIGWWRGLALLTLIPTLAISWMFLGKPATWRGMALVAAVTLSIALWRYGLAFMGIGTAEPLGWGFAAFFDAALLTIQYDAAAVWLLGFLALFGALAAIFLVPYVGDCARYLRDAPDNIEARNRIRALGLAVLADLHERRDRDGAGPRYDRIVVVAHSLGSVIAYDVMRAFFVKQTADLAAGPAVQAALEPVHALRIEDFVSVDARAERTDAGLAWTEVPGSRRGVPVSAMAVGANARDVVEDELKEPAAGSGPAGPMSTIAYQALQRQVFEAFVAATAGEGGGGGAGAPWRISDLVTMGSPLTHAALLLTETGATDELAEKVASREFPVSPPVWSRHEHGRVFYWSRALDGGQLKLQHSAMFALTAWTNLYFAQRHAVRGDFIGGPISRELSPGTLNVPLATSLSGGFFNHTHYWIQEGVGEGAAHIRALKLAVLGAEAWTEVAAQRGLPAGGKAEAKVPAAAAGA